MAIVFSARLKKTLRPLAASQEEGVFLRGDNGTLVLLIHGLTGTPKELKALANFLNKKGYSVFCPWLAKHGEPLWVLKNASWEEFYQSVKNSYLSVKDDFKHIFVGGLSMGALLALLLADEFKEGISGVVCLSPTLFYDGWNTPRSRFFLPFVYRTPLRHFFYFKEEPPYGIKNKALQSRIHNYYKSARLEDDSKAAQLGYPYFPVTLLYQVYRLVNYLKKRLHVMTMPLQIFQAYEDDVTSIRNSQFIYDRVKTSDKELVVLYDSYHVITADQEREKVAQGMENFFGRLINLKAHS